MKDMLKHFLLWSAIAVVLMSVFNQFGGGDDASSTISYSQFINSVKTGEVKSVLINGPEIKGQMESGRVFSTYSPETDNRSLIGELIDGGIEIRAEAPEQPGLLMQIFINWFPFLLLIGVWIFFMRQIQGGGGRGAMNFGRSRARMLAEEDNTVTFKDAAGIDEAKEEVQELVDFLSDPSRYHKLGGKIPRGVLMVGVPGTGKTLLARAIAGEAKVPFFTISGSDFVEMFVGIGASRVRNMFLQAKKRAPCIIFIDEIDAVGRHRGAGLGGGHDEREQTLNQLLVEMDGFDGNEGIIVIAATNRPDVLDPALLRPGRFDRHVNVPLPDLKGREEIIKVHMKNLPRIAKNVNPQTIARGCPGFSGADLANLVNESALLAARRGRKDVDMDCFEGAKDKLIMGIERRSILMSEDQRRMTAYHEAGHAIVGRLVPDHDPVYKVSIIPRGQALGVTLFLPEEDRYSVSKQRLESQISSLYGGRIAEELIYGPEHVTTGASNDIKRATELARNMVIKWGFSEKMGPLLYSEDDDEIFLGRTISRQKHISAGTAEAIDAEIWRIIDINYKRSKKIIETNLDTLHSMADALMEYETIDGHQIDNIMNGRAAGPPSNSSTAFMSKEGGASSKSKGKRSSSSTGKKVKSRKGGVGGPVAES